MESPLDPDDAAVEVVPVVVVSGSFAARPSAIPEIRDFVRRCLANSPMSDQERRAVDLRVANALLDAAGPSGTITVSFRIFPDTVEVDVLRSHPRLGPTAHPESLMSFVDDHVRNSHRVEPDEIPVTASFADWISGELRRQGMTMEVAARQLGVSVKTVSRWVGGATEPRLRDLRRIREVFGEIPFP